MYLVWTVCWNTTLLYQQHLSAGEPDLSGMYHCIVLYSTSPAQTVIHTMDLTKPKSSHDCNWGVICSEIIFDWTCCGSILPLVQFGIFFCSVVIVYEFKENGKMLNCGNKEVLESSFFLHTYASVKSVRQMQTINYLPIWWVRFSFLGNCSSLNIDNTPFLFQLARIKTKKTLWFMNHCGEFFGEGRHFSWWEKIALGKCINFESQVLAWMSRAVKM